MWPMLFSAFSLFSESLLAMSDGLEFFGNVKWELALCLLLAWVVVMAVLSKGIKSLGKARALILITF